MREELQMDIGNVGFFDIIRFYCIIYLPRRIYGVDMFLLEVTL